MYRTWVQPLTPSSDPAVLAQVEPSRPHIPAPARVRDDHLDVPVIEIFGRVHHVPAERGGARTGDAGRHEKSSAIPVPDAGELRKRVVSSEGKFLLLTCDGIPARADGTAAAHHAWASEDLPPVPSARKCKFFAASPPLDPRPLWLTATLSLPPLGDFPHSSFSGSASCRVSRSWPPCTFAADLPD